MTSFRIIATSSDTERTDDAWLSIRASHELQNDIVRLVVMQSASQRESLFECVCARYHDEFGCEVKLAPVQISYTLFPPEPIVTTTTLAGRVLRMVKDANGNELRSALRLYHQLVVYEKLRLTFEQRTRIADEIVLWGNGPATNDTTHRIKSLLDDIQSQLSADQRCIALDASLQPNEALMKAHNTASRRAIMDALTANMNKLRCHDVILSLQYLYAYSIIEHLDDLDANQSDRLQLTDDWDHIQDKSKIDRTLKRTVAEIAQAPIVSSAPASAHTSDFGANRLKHDRDMLALTVVAEDGPDKGVCTWDSSEAEFKRNDVIPLERCVEYRDGTTKRNTTNGYFLDRTFASGVSYINVDAVCADGELIGVGRKKGDESTKGKKVFCTIALKMGSDHVYRYNCAVPRAQFREISKITITAVGR